VKSSEEKSLTSSNTSNKKNSRELEEREEAKRRILEEDPHIHKDILEFVLSLPVERKIPSHRT
jgi:hypothetical protein